MKVFTGLFFSYLLSVSTMYSQAYLTNAEIKQIDTFIQQSVDNIGIPGAAIAIIKNKEVVYKNYLGLSNLEYKIPVTSQSLFRLHSLSKVFVSVGIFQLIEEDKISLDDPISKYLNDLPEQWQQIKVANLLSHSSGLPDMREEKDPSEEEAMKTVYGAEIQFPAGQTVSYNQTNFWLLNRIIRKISGADFQDYILKQFEGEEHVSFSSVFDIVPNRVTEYGPNQNGELINSHFVVVPYLYGAGGLTLSLDDFIRWDKRLKENSLIKVDSKIKMLTEFDYETDAAYAFTYGWFTQSLNNVKSYGFNGGGLVNYKLFPGKDLSIIWLTNGYKTPHNIDDICNGILGFIDSDLEDKSPKVSKLIYDIFSNSLSNEAIKKYRNIKSKYAFINFENVLNMVGYSFLEQKEIDKAILVFELNTEEYPESANTYDSLAEAFYHNKQYELSKKYYKKSLELNPVNENAKHMLSKIP